MGSSRLRLEEHRHWTAKTPAPSRISEHAVEVVREAGLREEEIAALVADGTLRVSKPLAEAAEWRSASACGGGKIVSRLMAMPRTFACDR